MKSQRKGNKLVTALLVALAVLLTFSACQPNAPKDSAMSDAEKTAAKTYLEEFFGSDILTDVNATFGEVAKDKASIEVTTNEYDEKGKSVTLALTLTEYEVTKDLTVSGNITFVFTGSASGTTFTVEEYEADGKLAFDSAETPLTLTLTDAKGEADGKFTVEAEATEISAIASATLDRPVEGKVKADGREETTIADLLGAAPLSGDNLAIVKGIYNAIASTESDKDVANSNGTAKYTTTSGVTYDITYAYTPTVDKDTDLVTAWTLSNITATKKDTDSAAAASLPSKISFAITSKNVSDNAAITVTIDSVGYTINAKDLAGSTAPGGGVEGYKDEKAFAEMFNSIDVVAFQKAFSKGITNDGDGDLVTGVTVPTLTLYVSGENVQDNVSKKDFANLLKNLIRQGEAVTGIKGMTHPGKLEAVSIPMTFTNYPLGEKFIIVSGNATLTLVIGNISSDSINGVYTLSADSDDKLMVASASSDETGKALILDGFSGSFSVDVNALMGNAQQAATQATEGDATSPTTDDSIVLNLPYSQDEVSVTYDSDALYWPELSEAITVLDQDKESAAVIDKKLFYKHFGTNGFLTDLKGILNPEETANGLTVSSSKYLSADGDEAEQTDPQEPGSSTYDHTLTLTLKLKDYGYYLAKSRQVANSESITLIFKGKESGNTFTATSFEVSGTVKLSDSAEKDAFPAQRENATVEFTNESGTIGTGEGAGIQFTVSANAVTGIATDFNYDQTKHEFVFTNLKDIEIK